MDDSGKIVDDEVLAALWRAAPEPPASLMDPCSAEARVLLDRLVAQVEPLRAVKPRWRSTVPLTDNDISVSRGIAGEVAGESKPVLVYSASRPTRRRLMAPLIGALFVAAVIIALVVLLVSGPMGGGHEQVFVGGGQSGAAGPPSASSAASTTPKAAAQDFALSVLASLSLPAGATLFGGPIPASLASPEVPISTPTTAIDDDRVWSVPLAPDDLLSYARAHPPAAGGFFLSAGGPPDAKYIVAGVQSPVSTWSTIVIFAAQAAGTGSLLRIDVVVTLPAARSPGEEVTAADRIVSVTWVPGINTALDASPAGRVVTDPGSVVALRNLFNELPAVDSSQLICDLTARVYTVSFAPSPRGPADFVAQQTCNGWSITIRGKGATDLRDSSGLDAALASIAGQ